MHVGIPLVGSILFLLYYGAVSWGRNHAGVLFYGDCRSGISVPCEPDLLPVYETGGREPLSDVFGRECRKNTCVIGEMCQSTVIRTGSSDFGIGFFGLGEIYLLGNTDIPAMAYPVGILALWIGSLLQYPIHLFLNMRFSQSVSMGIGVAQSVLAALLITGLGEGIWQFVPCSWSIRLAILALKGIVIPGEVVFPGGRTNLPVDWRGYLCHNFYMVSV